MTLRVPAMLYDAVASSGSVLQAARYASTGRLTISSDEGVQAVGALLVGDTYFATPGVSAAVGRLFAPGDARTASTARALVLTYSAWQQHFGGRTDILQTPVWLSGAGSRQQRPGGVPSRTSREPIGSGDHASARVNGLQSQ